MNKDTLTKIKKVATKGLSARLKEAVDPIDKIEIIADTIKTVLESLGVKELLLASPYSSDWELQDYENREDMLSMGETPIDEYIKEFKSGELIDWTIPAWIDMNEKFENAISLENGELSTYIVRLGIVDNKVKMTAQNSVLIEITGEYLCGLESDWLKLSNIPSVAFWRKILNLILEVNEVWEFNEKYPDFHRL